jgi:hypothetical protein
MELLGIRREVSGYLVAMGWKPSPTPKEDNETDTQEEQTRAEGEEELEGRARVEAAAVGEGGKQRSDQPAHDGKDEEDEGVKERAEAITCSSIQLAGLELELGYPQLVMQTENCFSKEARVNTNADVRSSEAQGKRKCSEAQEQTHKKKVKKAPLNAIQAKLSQTKSILSEGTKYLCEIEGVLNQVKGNNNSLSEELKQEKQKNKELQQVNEQNKKLIEELKEENKNLTEQCNKVTERTIEDLQKYLNSKKSNMHHN